jgi:hypothetical protein
MVNSLRNWGLQCLFVGLMVPALPALAEDVEAVVHLQAGESSGIVRISDLKQDSVYRGQSPMPETAADPTVQPANCERQTLPESAVCPEGGSVCPEGSTVCPQGRVCCGKVHWHQRLCDWLHNELGGHQCGRRPEIPLAGHYHIVYPVNPGYFDSRDGQVYAAPGYGGPVSVPLAPVVNHTYNYGWGIPSSRLTPVQQPVRQAPASVIPSPYPSAPVSY